MKIKNMDNQFLDEFHLDYLEFQCKSEQETKLIVDWFASHNIFMPTIHHFFTKNHKRSLETDIIYVVPKKYGYNVTISGMSARGLYSSLTQLYQIFDQNNAKLNLTRLDIKLILQIDLSKEEIREEHLKLYQKMSVGKIQRMIDSENSGYTSYMKFKQGILRVYNYYNSGSTSVEFELKEKFYVLEIGKLLKEGKLEQLGSLLKTRMYKELHNFPLNNALFSHFSFPEDYKSIALKKEDMYHLNINLVCSKIKPNIL